MILRWPDGYFYKQFLLLSPPISRELNKSYRSDLYNYIPVSTAEDNE